MKSDKPGLDVESSIWIARSPEEIWNYLVEVSNETQWRDNVVEAQWVSDPPYGVGSAGLFIVKGVGDWPWKVTKLEEPHIMSWDVTGGRFEGAHGGYRIMPEDTGSRITAYAILKPRAPMKIFVLIMKQHIRRGLAADLEQLKAVMEA